MNARERYLETLLFGTPDRIPFAPGGPRESTLARWRKEGLGEGEHWCDGVERELGVRPEPSEDISLETGVNMRMMPIFEEKILEHADGHYIVQDWMGNITEISDEYDYTYIRNSIDFVTRKWHKFPVESREDFEAMKRRYDPREPGRFGDDFEERCRRLRERDAVCGIFFPGPLWQLREWCGFEPLCMLFIEDPDFVHEMIDFWTAFVSAVLAPLLDTDVLDTILISEDMAYKEKSMISPAMTREFLQPAYRRWITDARQAGVPLIDMDSDGKIDELIPIWIESDIDTCCPVEVAAGNDLNQYRRAFGREMGYKGGIDKRCIAKGGAAIEDEIARVAPVVDDGGFLPSCDHAVPHDISWPNFLRYCGLLAELTGAS